MSKNNRISPFLKQSINLPLRNEEKGGKLIASKQDFNVGLFLDCKIRWGDTQKKPKQIPLKLKHQVEWGES